MVDIGGDPFIIFCPEHELSLVTFVAQIQLGPHISTAVPGSQIYYSEALRFSQNQMSVKTIKIV